MANITKEGEETPQFEEVSVTKIERLPKCYCSGIEPSHCKGC